ncbi:MAG TPA: multiheme c-type cytochrome [Bacteroidota bacterium]
MKARLVLPTMFIALVIVGCDVGEQIPEKKEPGLQLTDFESSNSCALCHPQYVEEWKGSMHAYATNDPIWMLANNSLQSSTGGRLDNFCWQCHSPIGFLTGNTPSSIRIEDLPPIVREGVNCDVCHVMRPPHTTTNQSIQYNIEPGKVKYASIPDPIPAGVHESGYDITFSRSEKCRECHDLIINGVPTEMTFTEWQNSTWGAMGVECQHCHMRRYTGQAAVGGPLRDNLHRHDFVGVDVAISDFPNKAVQRAAVDSLLRNSASLALVAPSSGSAGDSVTLRVRITNDRTGHHLPSSVFFNRQMWIEVTVWDDQGTGYESGHLDANGDLKDKNSVLEPNADPDLALFAGTLYKRGDETNVFELDSLVNNSIPAFESRTAFYKIKLNRPGFWNIRARLLFRPFPPYLFRNLGGPQYIGELPIFEMVTESSTINIQ